MPYLKPTNFNPAEEDDFEEIENPYAAGDVPPMPDGKLITDQGGPPAPPAEKSIYTPEEQARLERYLDLENEARRRADDQRGQASMSKAAAMLGTLGGVVPKSALDTEGAKAADEDAGRLSKLQEYLMAKASDRNKETSKEESRLAEKEADRSQQDKRDAAKQEFDTKMFSAKSDAERQKISDEYSRKIALMGKEYELKGKLAENKPEKEPSQPQYAAAGYARRVEQAEKDFDELNHEGFKANTGGRFIAGMLPLGMQSDQAQRFDQAKRNFVNAVLRKESGAAIAQSEFDSAERQYFPQPGDSAHVIAQKKANREQKLAEFKAEAGSAYPRVPLIATQKPGAPSATGMGEANAASSEQPAVSSGAVVKEGEKYFKTAADGTKKQVVKAFKDNTDGKIHYKFSDGTVE